MWPPGDTADAHNHETWGVIGVVDIEIEETRYRVDEMGGGKAQLQVTRVMRHRRGAVSCLVPGDEVHRMHNPTARDTVEIHVYGRDLVNLRRKTWSDDGTEKPLVSPKYLNCQGAPRRSRGSPNVRFWGHPRPPIHQAAVRRVVRRGRTSRS